MASAAIQGCAPICQAIAADIAATAISECVMPRCPKSMATGIETNHNLLPTTLPG